MMSINYQKNIPNCLLARTSSKIYDNVASIKPVSQWQRVLPCGWAIGPAKNERESMMLHLQHVVRIHTQYTNTVGT